MLSAFREIDAIANALNTTIAALKDRDRKLQDLANYDSLTGLLNKQNFHQHLERELQRLAGGKDSSALMFIDLDQFKYINDSLGHAAGDRLLARVAELLASRTRKPDLLSRFGGDEFTVIVKSVSREQAETIAASIVKGMQDFVFVEKDKPFNVYCSVGVAMIDGNAPLEEVFSQADMACYQAKSQGRNCYHIYDAQTHEPRETGADLNWAKAIGEALQKDAFGLRFQPLIGVTDSSCDFYQLRLQMKMPNGDDVDADQFMPAADRMGLSAQVGEWQLRGALKKLADASAGGRKIQLLITLPDGYFEVPDLQHRVSEALERNHIPAASLIFQLSERTALKRLEQTRQRMLALGELGCRFCLGDLEPGTGSLGYLNELAVDFVKIDASLLAAKRGDPVNRILVESTIRIAHTLGRQTIAEQIRNARAVDILENFEVDYLQGPFIGKPLTTLHAKTYQKLVARFCRDAPSAPRSRAKVVPMTKSQ